ncbi:hypothetical protein PAHAL_2G419700 [Panicum hallii]|uniref:Uncharacterized protein n=1 Tax=Panicum hallii TaxID=206008 RepID=A0A2T8KSE5_9POAL|nr:hypothetical protein PAHAL_2G419700 [Panicum hallii]
MIRPKTKCFWHRPRWLTRPRVPAFVFPESRKNHGSSIPTLSFCTPPFSSPSIRTAAPCLAQRGGAPRARPQVRRRDHRVAAAAGGARHPRGHRHRNHPGQLLLAQHLHPLGRASAAANPTRAAPFPALALHPHHHQAAPAPHDMSAMMGYHHHLLPQQDPSAGDAYMRKRYREDLFKEDDDRQDLSAPKAREQQAAARLI